MKKQPAKPKKPPKLPEDDPPLDFLVCKCILGHKFTLDMHATYKKDWIPMCPKCFNVATIERFCEPANLARTLDGIIEAEVGKALKSEVENYFGYSGEGRKAIRGAVVAVLQQGFGKETPHAE